MKSKYVYERMELEGEIIAVPVGENASDLHAVLHLNEEAMRIIELLRDETTEKMVISKLSSEYSISEEEISPLVHSFINQLRNEGLLEV